MYRSAMGFVKGLGFGVLACVAAVAIGSHQMKKSRRFRRNANRITLPFGYINLPL